MNLYNFKHGQPGEYLPKPGDAQKSSFPSGKFSGLMFGDYYSYDEWHQDQINPTDPTVIKGQHGFWLRRIYFAYDHSFSDRSRHVSASRRTATAISPAATVPYLEDAFLQMDV